MAFLLVTCPTNTQWVCEVANTTITYNYWGASLEQQATNVQAFANAMSMNQANYCASFLDVPDGISAGEVSQELFGTTDGIVYGTKVAYTAAGGDVLMDALAEAGQALLMAIGV